MKQLRPYCILVGAFILIIAGTAHAERYAYCLTNLGASMSSQDETTYVFISDIFPVPASAKVIAVGGGLILPEARLPWSTNIRVSESVRNDHSNSGYCYVYESRAEADSYYARISSASSGEGYRLTHIRWAYSPMQQSTHMGGAKPTEAEALYDAENWPGPFEDNQYKTIHSWDTHDCTTKQVTGVAGSSKPTTFYQCTVTFTYSDTASPVAKTALGKGDTQEAAIAAAKSSANTVLLTGITWGQPLCSSFYTTVKNPYKADYGHSAATKKENWACEADFAGKK